MATKKLNDYPFEGTGEDVCGERFVGRQSHVMQLQEQCTTNNFSIVGLPKVGKTSLACHSLLHMKKKIKVASRKNLCVIKFNAGSCTDSSNFFKKLVKEVYRELKTCIPANTNDYRILEELYGLVKDDEFDLDTIESFFETGVNAMAIQLVVIFDEFDKTRNIFAGTDFARLRAIITVSNKNIHAVVTSKRMIYDIENWRNDSTAGPSNFFQIFEGNTIFLEPFDDHELECYWKRLEPCFESVGRPITDDYKKEAAFYAGSHPFKLDIYNKVNYDPLKYGKCSGSIGAIMQEAYRAELEVLESVDLLDAAIQVVVGPIYDLDDDQVTKLKQYGFLREISEEEKFQMIGTHAGLIFKSGDRLRAFVAPSDYCTIYMKKCFVNQPRFWNEWTMAFRGLRQIVEKFLLINWGENWYDQDDAQYLGKVCKAIRGQIIKDKNIGITVSPHIEYLTETTLGNLFENYWDAVFNAVFKTCKEDFFEKYNYIKFIRNHESHNNNRYLSEKDREKANAILNEVKGWIDDWFKKGNDQDLKLDVNVDKEDSTNDSSIVETGIASSVQGEKCYEGTIVLVPNDNPNKLPFKNVLCDDFQYSLRVDDRSWLYVEEDDKVVFHVREKNGWQLAYKLRKKE